MTTDTVSLETGYAAAHSGAVFADRSALGMLKITGSTRLDLIHRMSTQDLRNMQSGEGRATVLTTDIGRIIDRLILYTSSNTVYALTSENNSDTIARYLMRYVFFNDDFHIEDVSAQTALFGVYGAEARARLAAAGLDVPELARHHWREVTVDGVTYYIHRTDAIAGDGYLVMVQTAQQDVLVSRLISADITPIDAETWNYLRIESSVPRYGAELALDFIPLEAGLWDDVSFSKGCYIGQEIIARMESRGKLAKKLLRFSAEAPLNSGSDIVAAGKSVGTVTSAASGPAGTVALGYVKTRALENDATLTVADVELQTT